MAELEAIRVLLKEQVETQKQQADAFQAQPAALQAELQVTKDMLQAAHLEGGGEGLLISFYVLGLKPSLQRELLVSKPTSLGEAYALAWVIKAHLDDQGAHAKANKATPTTVLQILSKPTPRLAASRQENPKTALLPTPPKVGLCFNCDNKWVRGHKCPGKFLLLMADEEAESEQIVETVHDEAMESGDISILNSLVGHGVVKRMQLPISGMKPFKVYIGSGETRLCENMCTQVAIDIQGLHMEVDLYVLPMKGPDLVLGIQWLQKLGKVTHNYSKHTMEFTWSDKGYLLRGEEALRMKHISLHHMRALLETDDVYGVYELYHMDAETTKHGNLSGNATLPRHPDIKELISQFETLFQVPTTLPPHRSVDHRIHLYPNAKPVNVRPYQYSHYQIGEMEKLANEMLSQGIIRYLTHGPYRTPSVYFQCLQDHEFYVKKSKSVFGTDSLEYLGHIISRRDVEVDPKKVSAVSGWPIPTLQRQNGFKWGETKGAAFIALKGKLTHAPILGLPDFKDTFVIEADASDGGIGAVLLQKEQPLGSQFMIRTNIEVSKSSCSSWGIELVANALSRVHEDDDEVTSAFMALSWPIVGLLEELKRENETLDELCQLHRRLDQVCQQTKYTTQAMGGLLQPLPTSIAVWEDISMDIITGLPLLKGFMVIFVVVDRFTKYAHFGTLPTSFNSSKVTELFMDMVVKHHGFPKTIVSDRDPIFVSKFWKQLFAESETQLNHSTAYHSQTDRQTEVVNRGLEQYLRAMVSDQPHYWVAAIDELLVERDVLLRQLRQNYFAARNRMELQANRSIANLPKEVLEGQPMEQPLAVCASCVVLRNGAPTRQILVQWLGSPPEEATWEWVSKFEATYPSHHIEGNVISEEEENVATQGVGRPKRAKSKPKWQKNYVM
nr:hypothetical protein [Tanacetum cinerariifolium]